MFQKTIAELDNKEINTQLIKSRFDFPNQLFLQIRIWLTNYQKIGFTMNNYVRIFPGDLQKGGTGKKIPFDVWLINFTVVASIKKRSSTAIPIYSKQVLLISFSTF